VLWQGQLARVAAAAPGGIHRSVCDEIKTFPSNATCGKVIRRMAMPYPMSCTRIILLAVLLVALAFFVLPCNVPASHIPTVQRKPHAFLLQPI
jgi:hypothetical protein